MQKICKRKERVGDLLDDIDGVRDAAAPEGIDSTLPSCPGFVRRSAPKTIGKTFTGGPKLFLKIIPRAFPR